METILAENASTRLALAVRLVDDYTGRLPIGDVNVDMAEKGAIQNPSGYYLFLDVPAGSYLLKVDAQYYFYREIEISLPISGGPVYSISLKPNTSYPFSAKATLVRGIVRDTTDKPVAEATVKIEGKEVESKTTLHGEFILYFKGLKQQDIIKMGGKRYVRADGSNQLHLRVTHPDYKNNMVLLEAEENKTTSVSITLKQKGG